MTPGPRIMGELGRETGAGRKLSPCYGTYIVLINALHYNKIYMFLVYPLKFNIVINI